MFATANAHHRAAPAGKSLTMQSHNVYIGLGSNLDNPTQQVIDGINALAALRETQLLATSSLYASAPIGPQDQPPFINAVALIKTALTPIALLDALQALEQDAGRVRKRHWGERTLDLDILLFGEQTIEHPRLKVPHPFMCERRFVLEPLLEVSPHAHLPNGTALSQVLPETLTQEIWHHCTLALDSLGSVAPQ